MTPLQRGLWVLVAACAAHVAEEYLLGWREWAQGVSGVSVTWSVFVIANAGFLALACVAAGIGFARPAIGLALPSLTLMNGLFFHIAPTIVLGRISPGVFSATLLYVPISTWIFWRAGRAGQLSGKTATKAVLIGAAVMALPFAIMRVG